MPTLDPTSFFDKLAAFMANAASLEYASTPRSLWLYAVDEADAPPNLFSVLRPYAGSLRYVPVGHASIQCETTGADAAAIAQSTLLWRALLDASGRPLRSQALTGHRINGIVNLGAPAIVNRDDKGRAKVVFNFDAKYVATA